MSLGAIDFAVGTVTLREVEYSTLWGTPIIAVGDRYLPAWEPPASSGFHLDLDGADPLVSRVPSRSGPDGVVDVPVHAHRCVDAGAGPQRSSLGASRPRRRFPDGPPDNGLAIAGWMESAVHFPSLAVPGSLQGRSVQTGRAHVAAPITTPAGRLPAMTLVAPTDNIGFPAVVPTHNIGGPQTVKYSLGLSCFT